MLNINEIKNGTPNSEVINPAGNSAGAIIVLAIVSLSNNKVEPNIIETGISVFPFVP